jgi:hypothetical protein
MFPLSFAHVATLRCQVMILAFRFFYVPSETKPSHAQYVYHQVNSSPEMGERKYSIGLRLIMRLLYCLSVNLPTYIFDSYRC